MFEIVALCRIHLRDIVKFVQSLHYAVFIARIIHVRVINNSMMVRLSYLFCRVRLA